MERMSENLHQTPISDLADALDKAGRHAPERLLSPAEVRELTRTFYRFSGFPAWAMRSRAGSAEKHPRIFGAEHRGGD